MAQLTKAGFVRCDRPLWEQSQGRQDVPEPGVLTIPIDRVNDDYCDCEESGIDETASNACDQGKFHCESVLAVNSHVPSSRVNDQHCDCCDCSDEFSQAAHAQSLVKTDTCITKFRELAEGLVRDVKLVRVWVSEHSQSTCVQRHSRRKKLEMRTSTEKMKSCRQKSRTLTTRCWT